MSEAAKAVRAAQDVLKRAKPPPLIYCVNCATALDPSGEGQWLHRNTRGPYCHPHDVHRLRQR